MPRADKSADRFVKKVSCEFLTVDFFWSSSGVEKFVNE